MESEAGGAMNSKAVTVRFYLDRETDQVAWQRLISMRQRKHLSLGRTIIDVLNAAETDDFTSVQQIEMSKQLVESILAELEKTLPAFIAGCVAGNAAAVPAVVTATAVSAHEEPDTPIQPEQAPEPDFSHSHASWGFAGG